MPGSLPRRVHTVTATVYRSFRSATRQLTRLKLYCLSLSHTNTALSANRHRHIRLTHSIHGHAANILCILSRPSVKLRPTGISKLLNIVHSLITSNGSIIIISRSAHILTTVSRLIRVNPATNTRNNRIVTRNTITSIVATPNSRVTPFLHSNNGVRRQTQPRVSLSTVFTGNQVRLRAGAIRAIRPLLISVPQKHLAIISNISNSNGAAVMLRALIPTLHSTTSNAISPDSVHLVSTSNVSGIRLVSTAPVKTGVHSAITACYNIRSSLHHTFTGASSTRGGGLGPNTFSCGANGLHYSAYSKANAVSLSIRFLPSISIAYPSYRKAQCTRATSSVQLIYTSDITHSLPRLVLLDISRVVPLLSFLHPIQSGLTALRRLNLKCLALNRPAPTLSNNRTRQLGLTDRVKHKRSNSMFIFSRPAVKLRPLSILMLLHIFSSLITSKTAIMMVRRSLSMVTGTSCLVSVNPNKNVTNNHVMYRKAPRAIHTYPSDIANECLHK